MASKPGSDLIPGTKARLWRVLSQGAACVLPWRCPVYRWRELVAGAGMEQENLGPDTSRLLVEWPGEREDPEWQKPRGAEYRRGAQGRAGSQ